MLQHPCRQSRWVWRDINGTQAAVCLLSTVRGSPARSAHASHSAPAGANSVA